MNITKRNGKWIVGKHEFDSAEQAFAAIEQLEADKASKLSLGAAGDATEKGAFSVRYTDTTANGRFPAFTAFGCQFETLIKALPNLIDTYNELVEAGKILHRWDAKTAAKPVSLQGYFTASEMNDFADEKVSAALTAERAAFAAAQASQGAPTEAVKPQEREAVGAGKGRK